MITKSSRRIHLCSHAIFKPSDGVANDGLRDGRLCAIRSIIYCARSLTALFVMPSLAKRVLESLPPHIPPLFILAIVAYVYSVARAQLYYGIAFSIFFFAERGSFQRRIFAVYLLLKLRYFCECAKVGGAPRWERC